MSIVDKSPIYKKYLTAIAVLLFFVPLANAQNTFTLKECIEYGLKNHPSVNVAKNNIENARQASREAVAGYLPNVNLNGEFDHNLKLQTNIIPASPPLFPTETKLTFGNKYTSTVVAQVDQPIYNQSLITGLKANRPSQDIATLSAEQNRQNLIYAIASSYFQVITLQKQLELLTNNKDRTEKLFKVAQLQADAGVAKKVDAKQVQVSLNNLLAQISVAENNLKLAQNGLKNAMGLYTNTPIQLADTARWLQSAYTQPQDTAAILPASFAEFHYNSTVDYKLQEKQIQLYSINAQTIRMRSVPVVSAFARYGLNGFGTQASDVFNRQFNYSTVGLKFSWSLFDGFKRNAQYRQALVQRDNAKLNLEINQASQSLQFQNAVTQFRQAQTTLNTNSETVDLAAQVYDNTSLQYKEGVGTLSDLLNAESSYREAQNNYILSLINYYLAQLDVERANSTLEEYYNKL